MFTIVETLLTIALFSFYIYKVAKLLRNHHKLKQEEKKLYNSQMKLKLTNSNGFVPEFKFAVVQDSQELKIENSGNPLVESIDGFDYYDYCKNVKI